MVDLQGGLQMRMLAMLIGIVGVVPMAAQAQPAPIAAAPVPTDGVQDGADPTVQMVPVPAPATETAPPPASAATDGKTFAEDDVLGAAEDLFGRGAEGLAEIVRKTFKARGQPNAYIVGREVGGAFVVGLRYGSGTLHHRVEGERPVHWTGPSIGFDVGGDGSKVFALVYDLNDSEDLFRRYPAAEGKAYLVGGFTAEYLQRDDVVIVPIKLGVGVRLGINAGYMNFTSKTRVNPF